MNFTLHDDYIVIVTLPTDSKQIEMGIHQKNGSFATWEVADGNYQQTHYFSDRDSATEDLCSRTLDELRLKKQVQKKEQERGR
ncbi:hypothetical protein IMSAGC002_00003 [Lachnospiraceae bacterium]|nr:hypothetical protein IMSAGC002_00003 [Lachnospiraceae bacterium]